MSYFPDENANSPVPRKSGRKIKQRILKVDGHSILAENNYVVRGHEYIYGIREADPEYEVFQHKKAKQMLPPKKKRKLVQSDAEKERLQHNAVMEKARVDSIQKLKGFMASNLKIIEPFLQRSELESLSHHPHGKVDPRAEKEITMQPDLIEGGEMRDYQMIGLNFLVEMHLKGVPMILGDEMGLGKTLQTISFLAHLKETLKEGGPSLVVCPLSVVDSWMNEFGKWAPKMKVLRLHSSNIIAREEQVQKYLNDPFKYDVIVTTYDMVKSSTLVRTWQRIHFRYVVLDEGHLIKNHTTQVAQCLRKLHSKSKLILTGTPLQNNLTELWSLLNYLMPDYFVSSKCFDDAFNITMHQVDTSLLNKAHYLLGLFMLRRLKVEVEKDLPLKIETVVSCPLSECQLFYYKGLLLKDVTYLSNIQKKVIDNSKIGTNSYKFLNNLVMQLRKVCNHPFTFKGAEEDPDSTTLEELLESSGKLAVLDMLLLKLYEKKHRVVLFSQFTQVLDLIDDYCRMRGWRYTRIDGSVSRIQRTVRIDRFNAPESPDFIFLMSTRSGGMGINLQSADTCILFDSDWNPQPDLQAMARVHRIGQTKTVHVYRLITGGTIEERIYERAQKKLFLDKMVNRDNVNKGKLSEMADDAAGNTRDLLNSLVFGSDAIFGDTKEGLRSLPSDADILHLIDRTRHLLEDSTNATSSSRLLNNALKKLSTFDPTQKSFSTSTLCGVDFSALREKRMNSAKRSRNLVTNTDYGTSTTTSAPLNIDDALNEVNSSTSAKDIALQWIISKKSRASRKSRIIMINTSVNGLGKSQVAVLKSNNYNLNDGEGSIFDRELKGRIESFKTVKSSFARFENQDMCQACGHGGDLICCSRCPMSFHFSCANFHCVPDTFQCFHHRCSECTKSTSAAGGILFRCQSCPNAYCESCVPETTTRLLYDLPRMSELGYNMDKTCYIHCSEGCEDIAKVYLGWREETRTQLPTPPAIDVSHAFGEKITAKTVIFEEANKTNANFMTGYNKEDTVIASVESKLSKKLVTHGTGDWNVAY